MRAFLGFSLLLVSLSAARAEDIAITVSGNVAEPMRIAPAVIGQPLYPRTSVDTGVAAAKNPPELLIPAANAPVANAATPQTPLPVQIAGNSMAGNLR